MPAAANVTAADSPGFQIAQISVNVRRLCLMQRINKIVSAKEIPRKRLISSAPAVSIFRIIRPVELIKVDPHSIKIIALLRLEIRTTIFFYDCANAVS